MGEGDRCADSAMVEGFEAVRPNAFHTYRPGNIPQLEVSAMADNPLPASGSFSPAGGTLLVVERPAFRAT